MDLFYPAPPIMFYNLARAKWLKSAPHGWQAPALRPSLQNKFLPLSFRRVPAVLALAFFLSLAALSEHQPQVGVLPSAPLRALRLLFSFPQLLGDRDVALRVREPGRGCDQRGSY